MGKDFEELKRAIGAVIYECTLLRRENEILRAKSQVVDAFAMALNARPPEVGYGVDNLHQLQKATDEYSDRLAMEGKN